MTVSAHWGRTCSEKGSPMPSRLCPRPLRVLLTCLALAFASAALAPATAWAADNVKYLDENGATKTAASATEVTAADSTWGIQGSETWYVAQGEVSIGSRVEVTGDVHLILADGASLTVTGGINVPEDSSFTVYGQSDDSSTMGALDCLAATTGTTGYYAAVIGGNKGETSGSIVINGGGVATYSTWNSDEGSYSVGPGIGAGYEGIAESIVINGGSVRAQSSGGPAIGAGDDGTVRSIEINGGDVTASSSSSTGIGSSESGVVESIVVNGGSVHAKGRNGAAIGSERGGGATIVINGGTVEAIGYGGGEGIGGGAAGTASTRVTIAGGSVTATGSTAGGMRLPTGAGIGGQGAVTVTITGGTVTASGGSASGYYYTDASAGIGGSNGGSISSITITGGSVTTTSEVAGIGRTNEFHTGPDGNAVIVASSIGDYGSSSASDWSGVIFEGSTGRVYGTSAIPTEDFAIPEGATLTVPASATLDLSNVALKNSGTLNVEGKVVGVNDLKGFNRIIDVAGLTNLSVMHKSASAASGATVTLIASEGYAPPASISLTDANGGALPEGSYSYNADSGEITIAPVTDGVVTGIRLVASALKVPTAADFSFEAPAGLVYDGQPKAATVTGTAGMGDITVRYFDAEGAELEAAPANVGTYTVRVDVAVGNAYGAASGITAESWTFEIEPATLSVSPVAPKDVVYGDPAPATYGVSATGWADGDEAKLSNALAAALSFSTDYKAGDSAGTYDVRASWKDGSAPAALANYTVTFQPVSFSVAKAPVAAVSVSPLSSKYTGEPVSDLTVKALDANSSVSDGTVTFTWFDASGSALEGAPTDVGTYTLRVSIAEGTNHLAKTAEFTYAIAKADAVTVTVGEVSGKTYDGALAATGDRAAAIAPLAALGVASLVGTLVIGCRRSA